MSKCTLDAYLFFMGNCREAMEFYHSVFGGELTIKSYREMMGDEAEKPDFLQGMEDSVMHAHLHGGVIDLMASDSTRKEPFGESFISLSITSSDEDQLRGLFDKLAEGGKITSEMKKESWGAVFGSVTDKFGVDWMVNVG